MRKEVVLAGRKLITYVYAVDKQLTEMLDVRLWRMARQIVKFRLDTAMCFVKYGCV